MSVILYVIAGAKQFYGCYTVLKTHDVIINEIFKSQTNSFGGVLTLFADYFAETACQHVIYFLHTVVAHKLIYHSWLNNCACVLKNSQCFCIVSVQDMVQNGSANSQVKKIYWQFTCQSIVNVSIQIVAHIINVLFAGMAVQADS